MIDPEFARALASGRLRGWELAEDADEAMGVTGPCTVWCPPELLGYTEAELSINTEEDE
jgi:hypothetical protein